MTDFTMLETILDDSFIALKSGNLPQLLDLSERTEAALDFDHGSDSGLAERVREKARRNEVLIAAAIKGVKAARQRARDLSAAGQFSTYDAAGQRNQVGHSSGPAARRV